MNFDLSSSVQACERAIFVAFCDDLAPQVSKRYFAEAFLESYISLIV